MCSKNWHEFGGSSSDEKNPDTAVRENHTTAKTQCFINAHLYIKEHSGVEEWYNWTEVTESFEKIDMGS